MSYEYTMNGMGSLGFSDPRATCSEISGGETRCFRSSESSSASRNNCRTLSQTCQVGGDSGSMYCCPQFGSVRAPASGASTTPTTEQGGSVLTQAVNTMKGILGFGVGIPQTTPGTGQSKSVEDVAHSVETNAKDVAIEEASDIADETAGGSVTDPAPQIQPWYQQYQMPILIGTAAVGLLTTVIWLVARKK